ncbi:MAG: hypothetical protein GY928_29550 [Colwellia sp.]|nr:hypothetical protein [Colwellia sp.]
MATYALSILKFVTKGETDIIESAKFLNIYVYDLTRYFSILSYKFSILL